MADPHHSESTPAAGGVTAAHADVLAGEPAANGTAGQAGPCAEHPAGGAGTDARAAGAPPLPYGLYAAIRERADARAAPLVDGLVRSSLVLEPVADGTPEGSGPGTAGVGRIGGLPALPDGTEWPGFAGRPMQLLAQLDCAALAEAFRAGDVGDVGDSGGGGDAWPLPAAGLLLFFGDDLCEDYRGTGCRVLHLPPGPPTGPESLRPAPDGVAVVPPTTVAARRELCGPSYEDRELEALFPDDFLTVMDLSTDFRKHLPGADLRVLGWCDSGTGRPDGFRPLLQIECGAAGLGLGEVVNVSFWITDEDLAAGRFDRVRHGFEVA
ncbi:DUF1963 domain-containing protein [Kitasatospora sp. NPDC054939]